MYEKPEIDFRDWLASVSDPEERARFAREAGHTDRWHRRTPSMCAGGGFNAAVNGCITGAKGAARRPAKDRGDDNA